ncbi:MAG TPA: glycosyltransferase family 9 protein [Opitutaceae bacterium]|nr:glycosyltransferase family 9 protein [Opitutaceae bacterium]
MNAAFQPDWKSTARIRLGAIKQSALETTFRWRTLLPLLLQARKVTHALRDIKRHLPPGTPLVGVLLAEHIGDIVAAEPVIPYLKNKYAGAHLVWLSKPAFTHLLRYHPQIDSLVEISSISEAAHIVRSGILDTAVDLHINRKRCLKFGRPYAKRWGDTSVDIRNYYARGALLEALSLSAGLPALTEQPRLYLGPISSTVDRYDLPKRYVVFHARSNELARNWNDTAWTELARRLINQFGISVVEVGLQRVARIESPRYFDLCGKLSIVETAEVIRRASGFIGIDSGPAHIANAFERPSVVLLGAYAAFPRYMPYTGFLRENASDMVIQWPTACADIPVDEVVRRFGKLEAAPRYAEVSDELIS